MRELKFRIWNGSCFVTTPDTYIKTSDGSLWDYDHDYGGTFSSHQKLWSADGKIQQYTGLTDKNGKEIYEGDIVELILANQTHPHTGKKFGPKDSFGIYEVYYSDFNAAYYLRVHRKNWLDCWFTTEEDCENRKIEPMIRPMACTELPLGKFGITHVIGNIFENPELLKQ